MKETSCNHHLVELAENALSAELLGKPVSNIALIVIEIEKVMSEEDVIQRLKDAELHYLEPVQAVRK